MNTKQWLTGTVLMYLTVCCFGNQPADVDVVFLGAVKTLDGNVRMFFQATNKSHKELFLRAAYRQQVGLDSSDTVKNIIPSDYSRLGDAEVALFTSTDAANQNYKSFGEYRRSSDDANGTTWTWIPQRLREAKYLLGNRFFSDVGNIGIEIKSGTFATEAAAVIGTKIKLWLKFRVRIYSIKNNGEGFQQCGIVESESIPVHFSQNGNLIVELPVAPILPN